MSAIAGRVLILPKGDYDATKTYEFLDLVNHNSSSWLAKKASQGVEPSDANSEFWQKFGSSFTVDGETITIDENGVISAVGGTAEKVTYENESVEDVTNVKEALDNIYSDYAEKSALANYLPLSGGRLRGNNEPLSLENTTGDILITTHFGKSGYLGALGISGSNNPIFGDGLGVFNTLLHTGNKPSGSYTGNGSGSFREIATGGIGNVIAISGSNNTKAIIIDTGGFAIGTNGNIYELPAGTVYMSNGLMTTATDDVAVNANGVTYTYRVL